MAKVSARLHLALLVRILLSPMPCNTIPSGHPHLTLRPGRQILDKAFESHESASFANDAAVQANGHHLRCASVPFGEQDIEGRLEILEERLWREGTCRAMKLEVVVVVPRSKSASGERRM